MIRFLVALSFSLSGCSLLIDTSLNGLKCANKQCLPGYTCRVEDCVQDSSLKEGQTCTDNIQCEGGLVCPPALFVCSKPCARIYDLASECETGKVCAPFYDLTNKGKFKGGACVDTECASDAADLSQCKCKNADGTVNTTLEPGCKCKCEGGRLAAPNENNRCIRLASNGGLCLPTCLVGIRVADSSRGVDQCVADLPGNPTHCGRVATGDLVCVPAGAAPENSKCTLFPLSVGPSGVTGSSGPTVSLDACSLNLKAGNVADLPLLCLNARGNVDPADGELRCRKGACNPMVTTECTGTTQQVCDTKLGVTFCKGATE